MGCNNSKAVVPAEGAVGASDVQQQQAQHVADGSTKPWKKNQVVPVQDQHGVEREGAGSASHAKRPASSVKAAPPGAAVVAFVKDDSPAHDQGQPYDVFDELRRLCEQKLTAAPALARLAERLLEITKMHLSVALRSHSKPKDADALRKVVEHCVACLNRVVQPLLTHITRVLSNRQAGSSWSEATSWDQMEFSDFLGVLEDACTSTYELGVMEMGRPVTALMDILHQLRQHCDSHHISLPPSASQVSCLDELMGMLGIIYFRKVVLETPDSAAAKLDQYQQLQEQVGWSDSQLATCTGPDARAMLLYLQQVAAGGEKRTNVTVRRCAAFWDAFEAARHDGLLSASHGPKSHKYFPSFVDEMAGAGAGAASVRKAPVEAGEGHGPRKEFFALAGQDMAGRASSAAQGAGDDDKAGDQQQHAAAAGSSAGGHGPGSRPALWVFNRTAGAYWYNTGLSESPELKGAYAFAGWLMGQSLLNRAPLGLPLPPVLFRGLLEGGAGGAAAHGAHGADGATATAATSGFQPTLEMLSEFDPDAANAVRNVAGLPKDQLAGMLELEGLPGGWSAEQYTAHAVAQVLRDGVAWQAGAVAAGLFAAVDRRLLRAWQLGPQALAGLVSGVGGGADGSAPEDLSTLFRVALDEELVGPSACLVEMLWQVLAGWPAERRLRFVEFVTGTSRLPLPGSELLKIQAPFVAMGAAEHKATLGMLPQAHTCDNLLELPNYWESLLQTRGVKGGPAAVARGAAALTPEQLTELRDETRRILGERLEIAVLNFQGYGLDERSSRDDEDEDEDQDVGVGRQQSLAPAEPSPEPDLPLTPAALTADSLASLARLSASSSMLHSSHPLTFDQAVPSPHNQTRNRRASHFLGAASAAGLQSTVMSPAASPSPARYTPNLPHMQPPPPPQLAPAPVPPPPQPLTQEERDKQLMAAFDVDDTGRRKGGGPMPPPRAPSSSSSESLDDGLKL
ncbi:hypothetical protein CHLRE_12g548100v5 [Chlamydomonas reinhardtii]|uniref:HECT-type E3 ubiquitin transferase n=1 Tax=Chlamydomonas reinhardtii TaxID=3055 RepID=A0A2K3D6D9_CHLRE|nr:uncharacterized protein CHLRE_12g548100v5 [Chlamydomonas reinhardtii]PNW76093.1 hypothetical protein CHLRE_12g548100v5 [Chlamydomonas reinhardtii]